MRAIGITGAPGGGKSTLARRLSKLTRGVILATDRYLPDYAGLEPAEYDLPEHADLPLLAQHIESLASGTPTDIPVWSFDEHARVGTERIEPAASSATLVIVEGIHALTPPVLPLLDLAVFVEASPKVRLDRFIAREEAGERGWEPAAAGRFLTSMWPIQHFRSTQTTTRPRRIWWFCNDGHQSQPDS